MGGNVPIPAIERLLSPRSIALVGATENSAWSQSILQNLRHLGYQGAIHLVHPTKREQFGQPCWPSLQAIPEKVDHAWVMTSTGAVPSVLADCAAREVRSVTLLTSGFREVGPAGAEREEAVVRFCQEHGIAMLGPNCLGFINARESVPAYALALGEAPVPGRIGAVLQSGALLLHVHRLAVRRGIGISYLISSGNEAMLDATDCLAYLVEDPGTKVIMALMEGIRDPQRFRQVALQAAEAGKPMVVLKTGRTGAAARAATAHTGALTGDDRIVDGFLRQLGVIRVSSAEEMVETAAMLEARGWPESGRRVAIIAPSGGACGIFADLCQEAGLEIPDFRAETKAALREILPDFATPMNPLDTTGYVVLDGTLLPRAAAAVAAEPECDMLAVVYDLPREPMPNMERMEDRLQRMSQLARTTPRYLTLVSTVAGELTPFAREVAARYGLHTANGLALGAAALRGAVQYGQWRRHWSEQRRRAPTGSETDRSEGTLPPLGPGPLDEQQSKALLRAFGIPTAREVAAPDAEAAVRAAAELGGPVVLKVLSPDLPHKTEAGAVALNLRTPVEVREAYDRIMAAALAYRPGARIGGVLVAEQITGAVEMLAGISVDPQFGPAVVVGMGGVLVEVLNDAAIRLPPFDKAEAMAMVEELRGRRVLAGVRGRPPADIEALADTLVKLGHLALALTGSGSGAPRLRELDINPLFVLPEGCGVRAADALAVFEA